MRLKEQMMNAKYLLTLTAAALLAGCATPSSQSNRLDSTPVYSLSPEERRLQEVENKLSLVQRRLDALNTMRFDDENLRLRDDMRTLRGDVEKIRFELAQGDKRNRELYQDMDRRLKALETAPTGAAPAPGYAPSYSAPAPAAPVAPVPSNVTPTLAPAPAAAAPVSAEASAEEEGAYLASFDLLKSGKYDEAVRGFRGVLEKWPRGRYADNAAYWMGEASFVKRDFNTALAAFLTVANNFPNSAKVADATLKAGLTQTELGQTDAARTTLQAVVRKYPSSNAAKLAQQKLDGMGSADSKAESERPRR